jgi:exodeoxyribonuclease V gamma subunit
VVLAEITGPLDELVRAGQSNEPAVSVDVQVDLPGSVGLIGTVADVRGDVIHTVTYSKLGPAARLTAWLRLLALTASAPDRPFEACTVGRSRSSRATISVARLGPLGPDAASRLATAELELQALVDLFLRGMREPLPLYHRTSAAWAEAVKVGRDPHAAAASAWTSEYSFDKEDRENEHRLVLGDAVGFDEAVRLAGSPQGDEAAWEPAETTRVGVYARRLWDGLLAHEQVIDQ